MHVFGIEIENEMAPPGVYLFRRDISPNNIVHCGGQAILLDFHAATRMDPSGNSSVRATGKLSYMARSLHFDGGQHSCLTDMESLFYSLLDVASDGHALSWRNLTDQIMIRCGKHSTITFDLEWEVALGHCKELLRPYVNRVRNVVCQEKPTVTAYMAAFGWGEVA